VLLAWLQLFLVSQSHCAAMAMAADDAHPIWLVEAEGIMVTIISMRPGQTKEAAMEAAAACLANSLQEARQTLLQSSSDSSIPEAIPEGHAGSMPPAPRTGPPVWATAGNLARRSGKFHFHKLCRGASLSVRMEQVPLADIPASMQPCTQCVPLARGPASGQPGSIPAIQIPASPASHMQERQSTWLRMTVPGPWAVAVLALAVSAALTARTALSQLLSF
jgi:hypothetical protein